VSFFFSGNTCIGAARTVAVEIRSRSDVAAYATYTMMRQVVAVVTIFNE
jgi:hypothetical protein